MTDEASEIVEEIEQEKTPEEIIAEKDREIQMLRDHDEAVRDLADDVEELSSDYEHKKSMASAAKKRLEDCYARLAELARSRPTFGPLFEKAKPEESAEPVAQSADAWRSVEIGHLAEHGATEGDIEKLIEAGLTTLGKLADRSSEGGLSWFADVPGIGQVAADRIQDAATAFAMAPGNRDLYLLDVVDEGEEFPGLSEDICSRLISDGLYSAEKIQGWLGDGNSLATLGYDADEIRQIEGCLQAAS